MYKAKIAFYDFVHELELSHRRKKENFKITIFYNHASFSEDERYMNLIKNYLKILFNFLWLRLFTAEVVVTGETE